jgi:PAS domain S-box-containing protein
VKFGEVIRLMPLSTLLPGSIGLLLFIMVAVHGYRTLEQAIASSDARKETRDLLFHATELFSLIKDVESSQRGYLLSGDTAYLGPYELAMRHIRVQHDQIELDLRRAGVTPVDIQLLRDDIERRLRIAATIVDIRRVDGLDAAMNAIQSGQGKLAMDALRGDFGRAEEHLKRRIQGLDLQLADLHKQTWLTDIFLASLGCLLLALGYASLVWQSSARIQAEQRLTEHADAVARLRGAELESVFEALPDLYFRVAPDGTILEYRGGSDGLHLPADQFLGKRMQAILPAGIGERFAKHFDEMLATDVMPQSSLEYVLPVPDGERHYEARLGRIPERSEIIIVIRDIEDKYQAEASIKKWADAFSHCAHGIAIGDARSNLLVACNPAFSALLGRSVEEMQGQPIMAIYSPRSHAKLRQQISLADSQGQARYEAEMARPDGSVVPVQVDLVSVPGSDGRPLYRVATIQDIRERQAATAALRKASEDLRAFARKLDHDIESERRRLSREVHDQIGQIFTALKLKLLSGQSGTTLEQPAMSEFDALLDEGISIARRIATDLRPAMLDDLGLGPALNQYARQFCKQAGLAVDLDLSREGQLTEAETNQLFRIAQEALTNVARHARASQVRVIAGPRDGGYVLSVEDDGIGTQVAVDGLGMMGMRERAELIGATLEVGTSPLGGARLQVSLSRDEEAS